jgi:hypothetical protein
MSTAERTVLVAAIAGAIAIGTYLLQHRRAGDLVWGRDIWPVLGIAASLVAFVTALLLAPGPVSMLAIPALALVAGFYLLRTSPARPNATLAGWAFITVAVAGLLALALRLLIDLGRG